MTVGLDTNLCVQQNITRHHYIDPYVSRSILELWVIQPVGPDVSGTIMTVLSLLARVLG